MLIIKTNIFEKINNNITSRKLYSEEFKDYSCEKAGSRLRDKYDGDFDEEMGELKDNLNDAEESLVDYLRDNSYSNIKPYLKRIGIHCFLMFSSNIYWILDSLLFMLWSQLLFIFPRAPISPIYEIDFSFKWNYN